MVGAKIDGWIGPNTINMTKGYVESNGITKAIEEYQKIRQDFYESLATFKTFGKGWTRRVNETKESALAMTK